MEKQSGIARSRLLAWVMEFRGLVLCGVLAVHAGRVSALETPPSYGAASQVDTPILRVPMMRTPPEIDGVMSEGEWEDAAALSGFWYDFTQNDFRFMAAPQTQLQLYSAYDENNLYFAFTSPVYPENSWLKARGRFPDVLNHPLYGMLWDDHHELEVRPYHDIAKGFQLGLFRWDVNPIGAYCDWYWTTQAGHGFKWKSDAKIRTHADGTRWVVEYAIPFKCFITGNYEGKDENGRPLVSIPPVDGTIYRTWLVRGIGGNGVFFNAFDSHAWNTTKTQLIFDSRAVSFQVRELGPLMDDIVDVRLVAKNHNTRSETVRLGFFVESAEGSIYSSFDAPELSGGLLELRPGEKRELRLRQPFPGISTDGNVLWFDVRSAGRPAKVLFRTRLIHFHSMEGGSLYERTMHVEEGKADGHVVREKLSFRGRRLDAISELRPPRRDFELFWKFSPYHKRVSAVVDRGVHGASEDAQRATEAKLVVMKDNPDEDEVASSRFPFRANFATTILDLPALVSGESYKVSALLFDQDQRIVGERHEEPFTYVHEPWQGNTLGMDDVVWEPFVPISVSETGIETLKHRITLAPSGLPAQLYIKPDVREVRLERRDAVGAMGEEELVEIGRGPQLRAPMRLQAVLGGKAVPLAVVEPAKLIRQWKSEVVYRSRLAAGGVPVDIETRYDCDGSMHCRVDYGGEDAVELDRLELLGDIRGAVDLAASETGGGGMTGADVWHCGLSPDAGVVWDSTNTLMDLHYNRFIPWFWFGSSDRAFSWYCDSDQGWLLDRDGTTMQLVRGSDGAVTWRVLFVNHAAAVKGPRRIEFSLLTHPAKPKPANVRSFAWHYFAGQGWATGYGLEPIDLPDEYLVKRWRTAASAPTDTPDDQRTTWRKDDPPHHRYGQWRNIGVCPELDRTWEDKATYFFERHIRVGRRVGWWMDEYFPGTAFGRSDNQASGNAYFRDPADVQGDELPWHSGFLTTYMRRHYKRLARVFKTNNVPQRQHTWSNNAANMLESLIWNSLLVEECGAGHRSFEVDIVTQFPMSLYQSLSKNFTGLATTVCADHTEITAGDAKRPDRQYFGRALLNDIGVAPNGPHGTIHHKEQAIRLLNALHDFGFFDADDIEKIPFWRNERYVRYGTLSPSEGQVYVTVYRRPLDDGRGYKALFVIMNERFDPAEETLSILDLDRILGGPNTLASSGVMDRAGVPDELGEWWQGVLGEPEDTPVLMDVESGDIVQKAAGGEGESYGPIFVPYHDFRVLYGESRQSGEVAAAGE